MPLKRHPDKCLLNHITHWIITTEYCFPDTPGSVETLIFICIFEQFPSQYYDNYNAVFNLH